MNEEQALLAAVLADSDDPRWHPDAVGAYRDWLDERGRWSCEAAMTLVLAYPEADGPRLLAARWWEEHGQSGRAEFVRVQCAIEPLRWCENPDALRGPLGYEDNGEINRHAPLRRREGELLNAVPAGATSANKFFWLDNATFEATVMGGASPEAVSSGLVWRRGFVHSITCTAADWLEHGDRISAPVPLPEDVRGFQPVEEVTLTTMPEVEVRDTCYAGGEFRLPGGEWKYISWSSQADPQVPPVVERLLHIRWGRVRHWHLPPPLASERVRAGEGLVADVDGRVRPARPGEVATLFANSPGVAGDAVDVEPL